MRTLAAALLVLAANATHVSFAAAPSKPDFSGVWLVAPGSNRLRPVGGGEPPLLPAAGKLRAAFSEASDPTEKCKPPGNPRTMLESMPFEILQRPDVIYFGYQWNRLNRFAYWTDELPPAPGWTYYGLSAASWDASTMVIRSNGYQNTGVTYLDPTGLPHSDKLELTERYTLKSGGKVMELRITVNDSDSYRKPWDAVVKFNKQAGVRINDDICVLRQNMIKVSP
jgi:hypothetical protein